MKKLLAIMLGVCLLGTCCIAGCNGNTENPDKPVDPDTPTPEVPTEGQVTDDSIQTDRASINFIFNELYNENALVDKTNGFEKASDVTGARFFVNGDYYTSYTETKSRQDVKAELYNDNGVRMVNVSGGMAFTIPTTSPIKVDYTIARFRTQYFFDDIILTATSESSNPYTASADGWFTYINEWGIRHLVSDKYMTNQNIERTNPLKFEVGSDGSHSYGTVKNGDLEMRPGYEVYRFDLHILDEGDIERPYYNIGIIHEKNDKVNAGFFVMKGTQDHSELMDQIVMSWQRLSKKGSQKNYFNAGDPIPEPKWNEETKNFFNKFMTQKTKSWGVFSYSMPGEASNLHSGADSSYDNYLRASKGVQNYIEEEVWGGKKYDVYMTYTHLGTGANYEAVSKNHHYYPLDMSTALAGGNGFDDKPVLEFTFQFTTNNNLVDAEISPMFDILRGKYDDYFKRLGSDIKEYGKPVMFRLNNEMNTDWTSYSGIMNLLDPDIFTMTWKRLYNIFLEQGCDNVIWVWNPIADSCPYSGWGEDLCYFPGVEYVQLLGGTSYEFNNYTGDATTQMVSFKERYSKLYNEKNRQYFEKYGMIIGEFACGSGGAVDGTKLGRNASAQAKWITDMFTELNQADPEPYVQQIKGLIWFNCNDYSGNTISNRLRFAMPSEFDIFGKKEDYSDLQETWAAFKKGFEDAAKLEVS